MIDTTAVVKFPELTLEEMKKLSKEELRDYETECCNYMFGIVEDLFPEHITTRVLVTFLAGTALNFSTAQKDIAAFVLLEAAMQAPSMKPHKPH